MQRRRLTVEALEPRRLLTVLGDANGDGWFDQLDLVQVLQADKYATAEPAVWEEGDWNGDEVFDQFDLIDALKAGTYCGDADNLIFRDVSDARFLLDFDSAAMDGPYLAVPWTMTASGTGTYFGPTENQGSGTVYMDPSSGTPIPVYSVGSGCATTTETGDKICWDAVEIGTSLHATITFTGGTGQLEDLNGGFTFDYAPDGGNPPNLITYRYEGIGTIAHGQPVKRPLEVHGDATLAGDYTSPGIDDSGMFFLWTQTQSGVSTIGGRFEGTGQGTLYVDETGSPTLAVGAGSITVASNEELPWVSEEIGTSHHGTVTLTPGTGRFENVVGGFTYDYTPDPDPPAGLITYSYVGRGTVTF